MTRRGSPSRSGAGRRRPAARHEDEPPRPADALQPRPGAGAEPDGAVLAPPPRGLPAIRREVAIDTSSIQFENDETIRRSWGDDGAIACASRRCSRQADAVFGARANLAKCLLYAINGGRDEASGEQVAPKRGAVEGECMQFDDVVARFEWMMDWLAGVYVNAMN